MRSFAGVCVSRVVCCLILLSGTFATPRQHDAESCDEESTVSLLQVELHKVKDLGNSGPADTEAASLEGDVDSPAEEPPLSDALELLQSPPDAGDASSAAEESQDEVGTSPAESVTLESSGELEPSTAATVDEVAPTMDDLAEQVETVIDTSAPDASSAEQPGEVLRDGFSRVKLPLYVESDHEPPALDDKPIVSEAGDSADPGADENNRPLEREIDPEAPKEPQLEAPDATDVVSRLQADVVEHPSKAPELEAPEAPDATDVVSRLQASVVKVPAAQVLALPPDSSKEPPTFKTPAIVMTTLQPQSKFNSAHDAGKKDQQAAPSDKKDQQAVPRVSPGFSVQSSKRTILKAPVTEAPAPSDEEEQLETGVFADQAVYAQSQRVHAIALPDDGDSPPKTVSTGRVGQAPSKAMLAKAYEAGEKEIPPDATLWTSPVDTEVWSAPADQYDTSTV